MDFDQNFMNWFYNNFYNWNHTRNNIALLKLITIKLNV